MGELKLNSYEILDIGETLDNRLHADGVLEKSELTIYVNDEELKKIDEDLYYRNNPEGKDFVPSEGEILVTFKNLLIKIISKKKSTTHELKTRGLAKAQVD